MFCEQVRQNDVGEMDWGYLLALGYDVRRQPDVPVNAVVVQNDDISSAGVQLDAGEACLANIGSIVSPRVPILPDWAKFASRWFRAWLKLGGIHQKWSADGELLRAALCHLRSSGDQPTAAVARHLGASGGAGRGVRRAGCYGLAATQGGHARLLAC